MTEIDPMDEPDFSIDRPEFNPLSVTVIVPFADLDSVDPSGDIRSIGNQ